MALKFYVGVIERAESGSYGVSFPDFPGCVGAGDNPLDTIEDGKLALAQHIAAMQDHGISIPEPTPIAQLDREEWDSPSTASINSFPVEVPDATEPSLPARRINVTMPDRLVTRIDAAAQEFGFDRSGLLAVAARQWLAQNVKQAG
ncbi:type II toxin-antitoxin system HicB family antitoxin [Brevundimonas diminuta]|uniref:type II toxin-antitoxin system HicB family antitoxin n=1 Tax=Brevundimonas diminuta TaxID=293 RepID=UPI0022AF2F03|nr:type II toxin-antitoxin system HicB family antitoxin [Brevundimonas diminuta]MCZ4109517.1 type II toxin-antitoxin system HicB family antitoxin [Brevundimonas diminuta]